jgi:hypothetical protein
MKYTIYLDILFMCNIYHVRKKLIGNSTIINSTINVYGTFNFSSFK